MVTDALVLGACLILVSLCWAVAFRIWYDREREHIKNEITTAIAQFVSAPDENTPSPLAVIADQVALLLAARLMQQLKAGLAGKESGLSKAEAAGQQLAMVENGPPWLPIALAILPKKLQKQLINNPQMVGALANLGGGAPGGGNHQERSIRERLQHH